MRKEPQSTRRAFDPAHSIVLRTDRPHSARIYDYILGGKDNFAADREAAHAIVRHRPSLPTAMRANRQFMRRVTRYSARAAGIRQFLDIGTGLPTSPNLHEVAQSIAPAARIVYVDNDPIVLVHARALMKGTPEGRTAFISGDMRDPDGILAAPELRATLDLTKPVALTVIAMLQFVSDDDDPHAIVRRLAEPLSSGSHVAISLVASDIAPEQVGRAAREYAERGIPLYTRDKAETERFFDGLDLLDPGVVQVHKWRPEPGQEVITNEADVAMYGAVARKP